MQPTVDIVIPTYKPGAELKELISRLEAQSHRPDHILIINTEERYWKADLTEDFDNVEVFHITKDRFDHAGTRHMGAGFSNADVLMFMTQDALPADDTLIGRLVMALTKPDVVAAYARQLPKDGCSMVEQFTRRFNYPDESHIYRESDMAEHGIKTYFCSNVCAAYNRSYYVKMGGFQAPSIFNEDMIFGGRAIRDGMAIAYVASAMVYHSHNYNCREQFHRYFDNGVSQADHPEIFKGVPAMGEGKKLVKATAAYLKKMDCQHKIPGLYMQSAFKLLGFKLGKMYRRLPHFLVRAFSLNKEYWDIKVTVD
ncbi:MAG: glycosyltransferase family 2 protein [Lachnospiraceae bacterium]|nr:glycosyltransferase family 2 protein [Lachnospiraceae bacterium]